MRRSGGREEGGVQTLQITGVLLAVQTDATADEGPVAKGAGGSLGGYKEACCVRARKRMYISYRLALAPLQDGLGFSGWIITRALHCYFALLLIVAGVALGRSVTGSKQALM